VWRHLHNHNQSLSDSGVRTGILATSLTRAAVIEAMQTCRVFSSDDPYIEVRFSPGDHWMGKTERPNPAYTAAGPSPTRSAWPETNICLPVQSS
jgi:hypothetical protein